MQMCEEAACWKGPRKSRKAVWLQRRELGGVGKAWSSGRRGKVGLGWDVD